MSHWKFFTPNDGYTPGLNTDRAMADAAFDRHLERLAQQKIKLTHPPRLNDLGYNAYRDAQELRKVRKVVHGSST